MTRNELIEQLKKNLKPNAEADFLLIDNLSNGKHITAFLDIRDICMNVDIDDPNNKNRGGITFKIKDELICR